jgi:hypothetical protein
MTNPYQVKFELEKRPLDLANDGGPVPVITDVHSIYVEDNTAFVIYDIVPDTAGTGLHFEFEMPALINRDELRAFGEWLASSAFTGTVH